MSRTNFKAFIHRELPITLLLMVNLHFDSHLWVKWHHIGSGSHLELLIVCHMQRILPTKCHGKIEINQNSTSSYQIFARNAYLVQFDRWKWRPFWNSRWPPYLEKTKMVPTLSSFSIKLSTVMPIFMLLYQNAQYFGNILALLKTVNMYESITRIRWR